MKKIILILSLLVVFAANKAHSQTWAPDGAEWYYEYIHFYFTGYVHVTVVGDTVIHDTTCRILNRFAVIHNLVLGTTNTYDHGNSYMYSDDDRVYIFENNKFFTLYDFAANIGDTIIIPQNGNLSGFECDSIGMVTVVDTGSMTINGKNLRRIYVSPTDESHWSIHGYIVETIGPLNSYMLPEPHICVVDLYEGGRLRCYSDPEFGLYSTGISPECDYLVSVPEYSEEQFKVFPNPCEGVLNIHTAEELTGAELSIYNNMGKRVAYKASLSPQAIIDLSGLPQGIYCITIKMGNYFANQLIVLK